MSGPVCSSQQTPKGSRARAGAAGVGRTAVLCGGPAHLLEGAAVLGEAPQLALQVDDAGLPPHHLDAHLVVLLLQLADLLPVLVLFDQALGVLGLRFVPGVEGLPGRRRTRPLGSLPPAVRPPPPNQTQDARPPARVSATAAPALFLNLTLRRFHGYRPLHVLQPP